MELTVVCGLLCVLVAFREWRHGIERQRIIEFAEGMAEAASQERRELANRIQAPAETVTRVLTENIEPPELRTPDMGPFTIPVEETVVED